MLTRQFLLGLMIGSLAIGSLWGYRYWKDLHAPGCDARSPDCQIIEGQVNLRPGMNLSHILVLLHEPDRACFYANAGQFKDGSASVSISRVFCRGAAFVGDSPAKDKTTYDFSDMDYTLDRSGKWRLMN